MSPCRIRERTKSSSSILSFGMMMVMGLPIASAAVQPNIRSAAAFQDMITPFKSLLTIASSEEATIAASLDADSSGRNDIRVLCPRESGESDGRPRLGTISTSGAVDSFLSLNAPIPALSVFLSYDDRAQSGFV